MLRRYKKHLAQWMIGCLLFSTFQLAYPIYGVENTDSPYIYAETTVNEAVYGQNRYESGFESFSEPEAPEFDHIAYDTGVLLTWKLPVWEEGDTSWRLLRDDVEIASGGNDTLYYEDIGLVPDTHYTYTLEVGNPFDSNELLLDQAVTTLPLGAGVQSEVVKTSSGEPVKLYNQDKIDMTPDGRIIAFSSKADDLVVTDENEERDIFVRLENGTIERVNIGINDAEADAESKQPSISDDGNLVVFSSNATNLDDHEWTNAYQVYLHHRNLDSTELVSVSEDGKRGDLSSDSPVISGDGRYIVYRSRATNLTSEDSGTDENLYVYDRHTGETEWITQAHDGGAPDGYSIEPAISEDGRYVIFRSVATNLVEGGTNGGTEFWDRASHIYLWERGVGIRQVSKLPSGEHLGYSNASPYMSEDGSKAIFYTRTSDAAEQHLGLTTHGMLVWDRDSHLLESAVYKANGSTLGEGLIDQLHHLSGDGRYVLFHSILNEQITPQNVKDTYTTWGLYLRDMDSGKVWLVNLNDDQALTEYDTPVRVNHDGTVVLYPGYEDGNRDQRVLYRTEIDAAKNPPEWGAEATLNATDVAQTYINLNWDTADGTVESYHLYRDGELVAELADTTYRAEGLTPGTSYTFAVTASGLDVTTVPLELTVTTSEEIDGEAGLTVTAEPGGIARLDWDAAADDVSVLGYRIERRIAGDDAWQTVEEIDGVDTTSMADSGLLADTMYEYRVLLLVDNQEPQEHTIKRQVQTPALSLDEVFWRLSEQPVTGYAAPGAELQFTVSGETNREAAVVVSYDSWLDSNEQYVDGEPVSRQSQVSLTEDEAGSGIYRGTYTIPNHASSIEGIEAVLTDGAVQLTRSPGQVSLGILGELVVEVDGEPDSLLDGGAARLRVWSDQAQYGEGLQIDEPGTYTISNLIPADDYRLRLERMSGGVSLATVSDEKVRGGRAHPQDTPIELMAHGPSVIRVEVVGTDGLTPLQDMPITVKDADTGQILNRATSSVDEPVRVFHSYDSINHENAERIRIEAKPRLGQQFVAVEQTVDLVPGEQTIQLVIPEPSTIPLTGKVMDEEGSPVTGIEVVATGHGYRASAVTDTAGDYTLQVFPGEVTVSASHRHNRVRTDQSEWVELTAVADQPLQDINLLLRSKYRHDFVIGSIRYPGEDGGEVVFEQFGRSEATRLSFTIYHEDIPLVGAKREGIYPIEYSFTSSQYESGTITACINGHTIGLPDLCQEIELDPTEPSVQVEFDYELPEGMGGLRANFIKPDNSMASARILLYDHREQLVLEDSYLATQDNLLSLYPLEPGEYTLRALGPRTGTPYALEQVVWITEGEFVDLGSLVMQELGSFWLQPGNNITVSDPVVMPEGQARFRVAYHHQGEQSAGIAKLHIHLPDGVTVDEDTMMHSGVAAAISPAAQSIVVPLGTLDPGEQGTLHFLTTIQETARAGEHTIQAAIEYEAGGETNTESIGSVNLLVGGMTMTVPSTIHERILVAQGKAPAGSTVRVAVDGQPLGQTLAAPNGYWRAEVEITGDDEARWLRVEAVAMKNGQQWSAAPAEVLLDPEMPRLTQVEFRQLTEDQYWDPDMPSQLKAAAGDWISFQTDGGVARFPRTMLAGLPFEFQLQFNDPQSVSNVRVYVEGPAGGAAEAVYDEQEQLWHAIIETDRDAEWRAGKIWVDFDHDHPVIPAAAKTMAVGEEALDYITDPIDPEQWDWPDHGLEDDAPGGQGSYQGPTFQMATDYYQVRGDIQAKLDIELGTAVSDAPDPVQPFEINNAHYGGPDYEIPEPWIWMKVSMFQPSKNQVGLRIRGEVELDAFLEKNRTAPHWDEGAELIVADTDDSRTTLRWHPAYDDLWVEHYELEQLDEFGNPVHSHEVLGDTFELELGDLTSGETYTYRVVAEDPAGLSTAGPELTFTAGDADQQASVVEIDSQSLAVQQFAEPEWMKTVRIAADLELKPTRVKIATDFMLDVAGPAGDIIGTISGTMGLSGDIDDLEDMLEEAGDRCGGIPPELQKAVNEAKLALVSGYILSSGMTAGGVALGMTGVGAPGAAAMALIGTLSDVGMGAVSGIQKDQAERAFRDLDLDDDCEEEEEDRKPPKPPKSPVGGNPSGSPVADPSWKIDPSGYVYEVVEDNRIPDVTTTLLYSEDGLEPYEVWDGEWWGEENPLSTDSAGWYGWDVPQGWWQVIYEKEGYETTYSQETYGMIEVPPPHFEVNVPMKSYAPPQIEQANAALDGDAVEVSFNRHVRMPAIGEHTAQLWTTGDEPELVEGEWIAIDAVSNPYKEAAEDIAQMIRFVPSESLVLGDSYRLFISDLVESYAEVSLVTAYDTLIVVEAKPENPDPGDGDPGDGDPNEGDPNEGDPNEGDPGDGDPGDGEPSKGGSGPTSPGAEQPLNPEDEQSDEGTVVTTEDRTVTMDSGRLIVHLENLADQLDVTAMKWQMEQVDEPQLLLSDSFTMLNFNMNIHLSGQRDGHAEWISIQELPSPVLMEIDLSAYGIDVMNADKTGLYVYDVEHRSWQYMRGRYDETSGTLTVMLDRMGTFSLLEADVSFSDIVGHWAQRPIEVLAGQGVISGRNEAQFDPNTPINRAEFTALLVRMLRLSADSVNTHMFEDVEAHHWFAAEISVAVDNNLVYGNAEHTFEPFRAISRQEMAAMIVRTLKRVGVNTQLEESDVNQAIVRFEDRDQLAVWAKEDMAWLVEHGLVKGRSLTEMAPREPLTRAEAVMMLSALLDTWWEHRLQQ